MYASHTVVDVLSVAGVLVNVPEACKSGCSEDCVAVLCNRCIHRRSQKRTAYIDVEGRNLPDMRVQKQPPERNGSGG